MKREGSEIGNDAKYESKLDTKVVPARNTVKGREKFAATKKSHKKEQEIKSLGNKGRNLNRNRSPESPSVGAAERARRRISVKYAELNGADDTEVMTDVAEHDHTWQLVPFY